MVKKIATYLLIGAVILAVWEVSNGDLGSWIIDVWNGVIFPILDWTSDLLIPVWNSFVGFIN